VTGYDWLRHAATGFGWLRQAAAGCFAAGCDRLQLAALQLTALRLAALRLAALRLIAAVGRVRLAGLRLGRGWIRLTVAARSRPKRLLAQINGLLVSAHLNDIGSLFKVGILSIFHYSGCRGSAPLMTACAAHYLLWKG